MEPRELEPAALNKAKRSDEAACRSLVLRYEDEVYALVSSKLLHLGLPVVDAVAQETFVRALGGLRRARGPLSEWVLAIATTLATRELQRHANAKPAAPASGELPAPPSLFAINVLRARRSRTHRRRAITVVTVTACLALVIFIALVPNDEALPPIVESPRPIVERPPPIVEAPPPIGVPPRPPPVSATRQPASGTFMIYATPAAPIYLDGKKLSAGGGPTKVEIEFTSGTLQIGDSLSPFQINIRYALQGNGAELSIDSQPWSILKRDGIALGKTPRPGIAAGSTTQRFELVSPGVQGMTVVLRFRFD